MIRRILSLMLAALMLAAFGTAAAEEAGDTAEYYVYTENGKTLNVRLAPNGEIIGKLHFGDQVKVNVLADEDWAVITFHYIHPENGEGDWDAYVNRRYLVKVDPALIQEALAQEADKASGDPWTDIQREFAAAKTVEPYQITARPARVTSWVNMRWVPSEVGTIIAKYKATEKLTVLKELDSYLQVQDPDTGDVGYIHKMFANR